MLAFRPGELKTIERPAWPFDVADLPCPPERVMSAVQYKPAEGHPYRPILYPPSKLKSLKPGWAGCIRRASMFDGIDPPRALTAAQALVPQGQTLASPPSITGALQEVTQAPTPGQAIPDSQPTQTPVPLAPYIVAPFQTNDPDTPDHDDSNTEPDQPTVTLPNADNDADTGQGSDSPIGVNDLDSQGNQPNVVTDPSQNTNSHEDSSSANSPVQVNAFDAPGNADTSLADPSQNTNSHGDSPPANSPVQVNALDAPGNADTSPADSSQNTGSHWDNPEPNTFANDPAAGGIISQPAEAAPAIAGNVETSSQGDNRADVSPDQVAQIHSILDVGQERRPSSNNDPSNGPSQIAKIPPSQGTNSEGSANPGQDLNPESPSNPSIGPNAGNPSDSNQVHPNAGSPSNPGQDTPSISPDQVSQVNAIFNAPSYGNPDQGSNAPGLLPQQVAKIKSVINAYPQGSPGSGNAPSDIPSGEIAQINSILHENEQQGAWKNGMDKSGTAYKSAASNEPLHENSIVAPVLVGGQTLAKAPAGAVVIGKNTLAAGSKTTIQGHFISVGSTDVAIDSSSYPLPTSVGAIVQAAPQNQGTPLLVAGNTFVKAANGAIIVDGSTTVAPGTQATVQGHLISADPSGIVVDGITHNLLPGNTDPPTPLPSPVLIDGKSMIAAAGGGIIVDGSTTLTPGAQATVHGDVITIGASNVVIDGSRTYAIPTNVGGVVEAALPMEPTSPVRIAGQAVVKDADGDLIIGGATLTAGAQTTDNGHIISVGASNMVVDGRTYALPTGTGEIIQQSSLQPADAPVLIGGHPLVEAASGDLIIGGVTLTPGAQATIQGHKVSEGASSVVIDGSSYALPTSVGGMVREGSGQGQDISHSPIPSVLRSPTRSAETSYSANSNGDSRTAQPDIGDAGLPEAKAGATATAGNEGKSVPTPTHKSSTSYFTAFSMGWEWIMLVMGVAVIVPWFA
ncbi:hypothetical protein ACLMJK_002019 [Lecanora helva]